MNQAKPKKLRHTGQINLRAVSLPGVIQKFVQARSERVRERERKRERERDESLKQA